MFMSDSDGVNGLTRSQRKRLRNLGKRVPRRTSTMQRSDSVLIAPPTEHCDRRVCVVAHLMRRVDQLYVDLGLVEAKPPQNVAKFLSEVVRLFAIHGVDVFNAFNRPIEKGPFDWVRLTIVRLSFLSDAVHVYQKEYAAAKQGKRHLTKEELTFKIGHYLDLFWKEKNGQCPSLSRCTCGGCSWKRKN